MKNDELLDENIMLKNKLEVAEKEVANYKKLYSDALNQISELNNKITEISKELEETREAAEIAADALVSQIENEKKEEKSFSLPKPDAVNLEGAFGYASEIIGKIVVKAAQYSGSFASNPTEHSVDLLNLVLGKTEVCKSEILSIANSDNPLDRQKRMMDDVLFEAENYFRSLSHQI